MSVKILVQGTTASKKKENTQLIVFPSSSTVPDLFLMLPGGRGVVPLITHPGFFLSLGKIFIPKEKPIETRTEEKVTLDPELEEALASASDTELYDLAG